MEVKHTVVCVLGVLMLLCHEESYSELRAAKHEPPNIINQAEYTVQSGLDRSALRPRESPLFGRTNSWNRQPQPPPLIPSISGHRGEQLRRKPPSVVHTWKINRHGHSKTPASRGRRFREDPSLNPFQVDSHVEEKRSIIKTRGEDDEAASTSSVKDNRFRCVNEQGWCPSSDDQHQQASCTSGMDGINNVGCVAPPQLPMNVPMFPFYGQPYWPAMMQQPQPPPPQQYRLQNTYPRVVELPRNGLNGMSLTDPQTTTTIATTTTTKTTPTAVPSTEKPQEARYFTRRPKFTTSSERPSSCDCRQMECGMSCVTTNTVPEKDKSKANFHVHFRNMKPRQPPPDTGRNCNEEGGCHNRADYRRLLRLFQQALEANRAMFSGKNSGNCRQNLPCKREIAVNASDESSTNVSTNNKVEDVRNFMFFVLPKFESIDDVGQVENNNNVSTRADDAAIELTETEDVVDSLDNYSRELLRVYLEQGRAVVPKRDSGTSLNFTDTITSSSSDVSANHSDDRLWSQVSGFDGKSKSNWGHPVV